MWIASRTASLPRKLKLTFEMPPETFACGRCSRIHAVASNEIDGVSRVLVDAGRDREHVRVDDDVLGRKADAIDEQIVARRATSIGARSLSAWPRSSKHMTTAAAP